MNCFEETGSPAFLISERSREYFTNKFYLMLSISLLLVIFMFILANERSNVFFVTGTLLVVASIPFTRLNWILSFVPNGEFVSFFELFFIKSYSVFLTSLILGFSLIAIGIIVKFFIIGFKINSFISWLQKRKKMKEKKIMGLKKKNLKNVKEKFPQKLKEIK